MKYCFGPVPSRRLGLSLGIDILPLKTCNLNCIYCELGRTKGYVCGPVEGTDPDAILQEFRLYLEENRPAIDVVTITASGEPTLHLRLHEIIAGLKSAASSPVAVLTNGTLLWDKRVRSALMAADIVLPSLDAATEPVFRRVNRPCAGLEIERIMEGIAAFRREFQGEMWLEVLLVEGVNDGADELNRLAQAIGAIGPHKVQINTVARPPAEPWARPVPYDRLLEFKELLGPGTEIAQSPPAKGKGSYKNLPARIKEMLDRRPMTREDLKRVLGRTGEELEPALRLLLDRGEIVPYRFQSKEYFKRSEQG